MIAFTTVADFKLSTGCCLAQNWEEMPTISSGELVEQLPEQEGWRTEGKELMMKTS